MIYKAQQELGYIRTLVPFRSLPASLLPTDQNSYPPLKHCGWEIPGSIKEQLLHRADLEGCNYVKETLDGSNDGLTCEVALDY